MLRPQQPPNQIQYISLHAHPRCISHTHQAHSWSRSNALVDVCWADAVAAGRPRFADWLHSRGEGGPGGMVRHAAWQVGQSQLQAHVPRNRSSLHPAHVLVCKVCSCQHQRLPYTFHQNRTRWCRAGICSRSRRVCRWHRGAAPPTEHDDARSTSAKQCLGEGSLRLCPTSCCARLLHALGMPFQRLQAPVSQQ